jgi:drug/metabolite transporter (DMT)-like permease
MNPHRLRAYIYLVLVAAIWGIAGPVIKFTLPSLPPFIFLTYRFFISTIVFLPFLLFKNTKIPSNRRDLAILTLIALLGSSINLGLLFYGYNYTTALDASLLGATSPIFVVAASMYFLKERVTKKEKIGLLIAFLGTLAIIFQPLAENKILFRENILGNILIVMANIAGVFYVILSKYGLKHKYDPLTMTFYTFFLGFVTLLPLASVQAGSLSNLVSVIVNSSIQTHLGVLYMALLSGSLAYFLYQKAQKTIEASEAALFSYLSPLFAIPLAVFWLKEEITIFYLLGAAIIATGVIIAENKRRKK